jgi:3-carboxy-cis,cis-muconate cycloisomerase
VAANVRDTVAGLEVDPAAMARNLALTDGLLLSERVVLALSPAIGRAEAVRVVQEAAARGTASGRTFADELLDDTSVKSHLSAVELGELLDPGSYLGSTQVFIDRALDVYRSA